MTIKHNIEKVTQEILDAALNANRDASDVSLLAVSKTKPVELIEQAIDVGQRAFGENYVQEGVEKVQYFSKKYAETTLEWHFIGPIQSNKSRLVAQHFDWVHTIDRLKIAKRLSDQRPQGMDKLKVLLQINTSAEESKSGCTLENLHELALAVSQLENLELKGLMCIPQASDDYDTQYNEFSQLSTALTELQKTYPTMDVLSMGMSGDMPAAIAAGSTMVRIGTAIFGARNYNKE